MQQTLRVRIYQIGVSDQASIHAANAVRTKTDRTMQVCGSLAPSLRYKYKDVVYVFTESLDHRNTKKVILGHTAVVDWIGNDGR